MTINDIIVKLKGELKVIKLTDIKDQSDWDYLDQNPDFAKQLVATLNQVDGFSFNWLWFKADSHYSTYDYWFSPNTKINQDSFTFYNDQIQIRATNRDDLLNVHYYQHLNDLANKYPINGWWSYYPQDQVLRLEKIYWCSFNIKLPKPIDQYDQKQINAMGKFITDVRHLINKDHKLDWDRFDEQWEQRFDYVSIIGIVFDLNDFANPKILIRWEDKNEDIQYENDLLKQVLKVDAPLLKFLNESDLATHFQPYQSKANKFFKRFLDA